MLRYDGVTVRYPGAAQPALTDLDLRVDHGERVALVGPSGAGKSTLLALAMGLVLPTDGRVEVFGVDTRVLGQRRHRATRRRIGAVHQAFALVPPLRVVTNVAAGRLGSRGLLAALGVLLRPRPDEALLASLDALGIADQRWKRVDQLSGGQQQRVAIARTLYQQPDLALADEPVSSLDPARSKVALQALVDVTVDHPDRSIVASLHDAPLALSHLDRIVGVRDGRIAFDAPASDVSLEMLDELYEIEELRGDDR